MLLKLRLLLPVLLAAPFASQSLPAQQGPAVQPPGMMQRLDSLAQERASHTSITFDRTELQTAEQIIGSLQRSSGKGPAAALDSITVDSYHYQRPAFYDPEEMTAIIRDYDRAGWKHLVNKNAARSFAEPSAQPGQPSIITDLWLHFHGAEIDNVTVLVRAQREMSLIQVTGTLHPLDLVHLSGHFGIPRVDENAVMVPAPPGK